MKIVKFVQSIIPVLAVIAAAVYNLEALMFFMNVLYIVVYAIFSMILIALLVIMTVLYVRNVSIANTFQENFINTPFWNKIFALVLNGVACYLFFENGYKWPAIMFVVAWAINMIAINVCKDLSKPKTQ